MFCQYPNRRYLRELFHYKDGKLYWRRRPREHFSSLNQWASWNTKWSGKEAGFLKYYQRRSEYRCVIKIKGKQYFRSRIVWIIFKNCLNQTLDVDHVNRDSTDDRIGNLRPCKRFKNCGNSRIRRNNTTGFKGVSKLGSGWRASVAGSYLGLFSTKRQAHDAYMKAARKHFGKFAHNGQ